MQIIVIGLLLLSPFLPLQAVERHQNLSYSKQSIHILPELLTRDQIPTERIIFLHIPKTAGTNLDNLARAISNIEGKFHYQRLPVPRIPDRSPNLITSDWIGGLQQLENNPNLLDGIPRVFFLTGHFPYGLHTHFTEPSKYITLIRHPLERELSDANFAYQRGYINAEEFVSYLTERMIDNPQVRLIAGRDYMTGCCTEQTFAQAIENIERDFLLAAPSEEVDVFLQILASRQGWGPLAYAPMQITQEKVAKKLDPLLAEALKKKHLWDIKLYEWIKVRWSAYKKKMILGEKALLPEDRILTLMPDHLSTRKPQFLSVPEISTYNQTHKDQELLKLEQSVYPKK